MGFRGCSIGTKMKDFKARQKVYNLIEKPGDSIEELGYVEKNDVTDIIKYATCYLTSETQSLEFPGKSYAVAILYALLIEKYFAVPFFESLDDPDLFVGTDRYFVPYSQSKEIYDQILSRTGLDLSMFENLPQVQKTIDYFLKEFSVDSMTSTR